MREFYKHIDTQAITPPRGCLVKIITRFILTSFLYVIPDCIMSGSFLYVMN